jgi:hypothetical protein
MDQQSPKIPLTASVAENMLTPNEFAKLQKVSLSWLAKRASAATGRRLFATAARSAISR